LSPARFPDHIYLGPRHLVTSTPEDHADHLRRMAENNGWGVAEDPHGFEVGSPCGRFSIVQRDLANESAIRLGARSAPGSPERWHVTLRGDAPVEVLGALTHTVTTILLRDPDALVYAVGSGHQAGVQVSTDRWDPIRVGAVRGFLTDDGNAFMLARPRDSDDPYLDHDAAVAYTMGASPAEVGSLWTGSFSYGVPAVLVSACWSEFGRREPVRRSSSSAWIRAELAPLLTWWPAPAAPSPAAPRGPGPGPQPRKGL
jgi:hypothetical protein